MMVGKPSLVSGASSVSELACRVMEVLPVQLCMACAACVACAGAAGVRACVCRAALGGCAAAGGCACAGELEKSRKPRRAEGRLAAALGCGSRAALVFVLWLALVPALASCVFAGGGGSVATTRRGANAGTAGSVAKAGEKVGAELSLVFVMRGWVLSESASAARMRAIAPDASLAAAGAALLTASACTVGAAFDRTTARMGSLGPDHDDEEVDEGAAPRASTSSSRAKTCQRVSALDAAGAEA